MSNLLPWQIYVLVAIVAIVGILAFLWFDNRVEARRKRAIKTSRVIGEMGLERTTNVLECYAIGDYSGLGHAVEELLRTLNNEQALVGEFWKVTQKVAAYARDKDPIKAAELLKILTEEKPVVSVTTAGTTPATK